MADDLTPREQGRRAAATLTGSAVDCPYLPTAEQAARSEWLQGFSEARPASSPASDPARADERRPDQALGPSLKGYKEG